MSMTETIGVCELKEWNRITAMMVLVIHIEHLHALMMHDPNVVHVKYGIT